MIGTATPRATCMVSGRTEPPRHLAVMPPGEVTVGAVRPPQDEGGDSEHQFHGSVLQYKRVDALADVLHRKLALGNRGVAINAGEVLGPEILTLQVV